MQEPMDSLANEARFAGIVYLATGITSAVRAVLARTASELVLATAEREIFHVPLPLVEKVEFPWWWFGGGMRVTVGGTRHTLSFSPPATVEGEGTDWLRNAGEVVYVGVEVYVSKQLLRQASSARRSSKEWKAALADVVGRG